MNDGDNDDDGCTRPSWRAAACERAADLFLWSWHGVPRVCYLSANGMRSNFRSRLPLWRRLSSAWQEAMWPLALQETSNWRFDTPTKVFCFHLAGALLTRSGLAFSSSCSPIQLATTALLVGANSGRTFSARRESEGIPSGTREALFSF